MKVKVTVKVSSKVGGEQVQASLDAVAFAADTVGSLAERVAAAQDLPFPEQPRLLLNGRELGQDERLSKCGIQEGSALDLVVFASEEIFAKQLGEFLEARAISPDELGLLYLHKYGASAAQALQLLGFSGTLGDFLGSRPKLFSLDSTGLVAPVSAGVAEKTVAVVETKEEIEEEPEAEAKPAADSQEQSSQQLQKLTLQLKELLTERGGTLTIEELDLLYTGRYGLYVEKQIADLGSRRRLRDFLSHQSSHFEVRGGVVSLRSQSEGATDVAPAAPGGAASRHERCLVLHETVSSRAFRATVARALGAATAYLSEATFLNVHHVVSGGAAGRGTAITGSAGAEVTLFVEGLPVGTFASPAALRGLLEATAGGLRERLSLDGAPLHVLGVTTDAVQLQANGLPSTLELRLSPSFATHGRALDALRDAPIGAAAARAWLAEQEVRFMKKQPEPVRATARLLKLWRERQQWSSEAARPSDWLLELIAVHAASLATPRGQPYDQGTALDVAARFLREFREAKVVWPAPFYGSHTVPEAVLQQRPLVMDPVNPYVNVADPSVFDPTELVNAAVASTAASTDAGLPLAL